MFEQQTCGLTKPGEHSVTCLVKCSVQTFPERAFPQSHKGPHVGMTPDMEVRQWWWSGRV